MIVRNIEVLFKPNKNDPYEQDYEIRISGEDKTWPHVIRLNRHEWYDLLDLMNALETPIKDPRV